MQYNLGFFLVHRKFEKNELFRDPNVLALWIRMLAKVTHKPLDGKYFGKVRITVQTGQFISSINSLSLESGVDSGKCRRIIDKFIKRGMVSKETSTTSTLFTIMNWQEHQINKQTIRKPSANEAHTKNKPPANETDCGVVSYEHTEQAIDEPKENHRHTSEVKTATNKYVQENNTKTVLYIQHPELKTVLDAWELKSGVMVESVCEYDQKKIHQYITTYGIETVLKYFTNFPTVKCGWLLNQIDKDISNGRNKLHRSGTNNNSKQDKSQNKPTDSGSAEYWKGK